LDGINSLFLALGLPITESQSRRSNEDFSLALPGEVLMFDIKQNLSRKTRREFHEKPQSRVSWPSQQNVAVVGGAHGCGMSRVGRWGLVCVAGQRHTDHSPNRCTSSIERTTAYMAPALSARV